ncbi:MAG TPA: AAA family ATPase, partial [Candidatus Limnocylindria bacterium]|nr:AAA family ATPase [Candidatus Limnocylindria bacterium]
MTIHDPTPNAAIRTFLIADVRGYTRFTVEHGDEEAGRLATRFAEAVRRAVEPAGGQVLELRGDEALVSFTSARSALRAALDVQRQCAGVAGETTQPIGVGIGLDAGEAVPVLGGYRGRALNLAARLCSLAGVGEVLASDSLTHLAGRLEGVAYTGRGRVRLKGFPEPVEVVGVEYAAVAEASASEAARGSEPKRLPIGSYLGALPAAQLVSRESERNRLVAAVDAVGQGTARAVLLAGEPGAGKTRLAQEIMLEVRNRGFAIGLGACLETREAVPYYPFLDALAGILEGTSASLAGWPYLQRLSGGSSESDVDSVRARAELDERVRREFAGFLAGVAETRPLAILLDDLHWADDSSLQLLQHLVHHLAGRPVFLLGTYRDVEVRREHPLEHVLRELRRADLVEVIPVRRLSPKGTSALVAASFGEEEISAEFAELVHHQTDGNPYFIQQVLRALVERGDVYRQGGGWERKDLNLIEIPESIRSTIGERVARLPEPSQEALRSAAVLGSRFAFDDLAALSELDPDALESALEAADAAGLVRPEGVDGYAFEHAVAQQCLLAELPTRRRRRLHARSGQVLEASPTAASRAGEIAFHYAEAD